MLSAVHDYSDPGEAANCYAAAQVQLTPTGRMPFKTRAVRVEFENLWMQQVHESGARIKHAALVPTRAVIKLLAAPGRELITQGAVLPYEGILRYRPGHIYYERTHEAVHWASMSLPVEQFVSACIAIAGRDLNPLRDLSIVVPSTAAMTKLRQLLEASVALAEHAPRVLSAPEVARGLEQSLLEAIVDCIGQPDVHHTGLMHQNHDTVMRRFYNLLEDSPERPFYIPEICAAIRVPERTLRICCQEHIGMSPKQYLLLRRMHLARSALGQAPVSETTVTDIATRFGFWHFGRFAGSYRSIFGELPSVTLDRPPR
jgi:AraC-like DNA-binding protein